MERDPFKVRTTRIDAANPFISDEGWLLVTQRHIGRVWASVAEFGPAARRPVRAPGLSCYEDIVDNDLSGLMIICNLQVDVTPHGEDQF